MVLAAPGDADDGAPELAVSERADYDAAVAAVRAGGFRPRLGVRINGLDTDWGLDDLAAMKAAGVPLGAYGRG